MQRVKEKARVHDVQWTSVLHRPKRNEDRDERIRKLKERRRFIESVGETYGGERSLPLSDKSVGESELERSFYQWCYNFLTQYVHSYVAISIIIPVSGGIVTGEFVLVRIAFGRITEKWDYRWQY